MLKRTCRYFSMVAIGVLAGFLLVSCNKHSSDNSFPQISFSHDSGFLTHDTTIAAGKRVRIGIAAHGQEANITYFSVRFNDGTARILLDSGMNTSFLSYSLEVIKTNAPRECWTFLVMDRNRVKDSVNIYLTKADSAVWGPIQTFENVMLGAHENNLTGSFYSLSTNAVMTLTEAFANQSIVDMVYYYGQYEGTLSSPNETEAPGYFPGSNGIANWTIKNETRYDTTLLTGDQFDRALNDSLILAAYEPASGKKKGKYIQPGMVFSFSSPAGKLGLIAIREVTAAPSGSVKFTVKIQTQQ